MHALADKLIALSHFSRKMQSGIISQSFAMSTSAVTQKSWLRAYSVALLFIFFWAAYARFRLPASPLANPDTPGYLRPAVSKLAGGTFQHTNGRNFLYPSFLLLVLELTKNFAAVTVVQHLLGLGTGGLLWGSWTKTRRFLRHISPRLHQALGLAMAAIYLLARHPIQYEHELRPEAITPFFAILNILLTLHFFEKRSRDGPSWSLALVGAALLVNSIVLATLKEIFILAILFSVLPVLISLFDPRETWLRRGAILSPGVITAVTLLLTERSLAKSDLEAKTWLPQTLFTIHADLIAQQMDEDVTRGDCAPYKCDWLRALSASVHEEIRKSRESSKMYPSLGFDADYLRVGNSLRRWHNEFFGGDYDAEVRFYRSYYLRTVRRHPELILKKVAHQMALFYLGRKQSFSLYWHKYLGPLYGQSVEYLREIAERPPLYPPFLRYVDECDKLSGSRERISQPLLVIVVGGMLTLLYPLIFFCTAATVLLLQSRFRRLYGTFAVVTLFVFSYNFGNCLIAAIVQSLDVSRYILTQYSFALLSECIGIIFLVEVAIEAHVRHRSPEVVQDRSLGGTEGTQ